MDLNKISKLTDEEIQLIVFLEKCTIGKWTINKKTGLVDIEGDFDCAKKKLKDFQGVRFGVVTGGFYCSYNKLTSLEGAPQEVGGDFNCSDNKLPSLEGAPKKVDGDFYCSYNKLTSLEGAPQEVGGNFSCSNNSLTSLYGAPQVVKGNFCCNDNHLTSLEGAPQEVEGGFYCYNNNLTSLKGAPQKVEGDFNCAQNFKLTSLEGAPQKVGGDFNCYAICTKSPTPRNTLELVFEVMQKNKIDYWSALCFIKSKIDSEEWVVMSKGIDERLSQDAQKGYSTLGQFNFSE